MARRRVQSSNEATSVKPQSTDETPLENIKEAVKTELTVLWEQLESWQRDNQYIIRGYRPASGSYRRSAASITYLHNETVNIWSHLVGAIFFLCCSAILLRELQQRYPLANKQDVLVFACFFLGAVMCLGMSATYHTIANHSVAVHKFYNKLDYLGIVFLIVGSFIPSIFYGFSCNPNLIFIYITMISTIGLGCAVVSLAAKFATPEWRPFRAFMFLAMGLSAIFPVVHGLIIYGWERMTDLIALPWLVSQGALYVLGAILYAARFPERWRPGQFDIFGSSHQIFHFLVVAAAMTHLRGLLLAFDNYHQNSRSVRCPD